MEIKRAINDDIKQDVKEQLLIIGITLVMVIAVAGGMYWLFWLLGMIP